MDVTVLVAPKGSGSRPVRFSPSVHTVSIPEGKSGLEALEAHTRAISAQYHNGIYRYESTEIPADLTAMLERFEAKVSECEAMRIVAERSDSVYRIFETVQRIHAGFFIPLNEYVRIVREVYPHMTVQSCYWILQFTAVGRRDTVDYPTFLTYLDSADRYSQKVRNYYGF